MDHLRHTVAELDRLLGSEEFQPRPVQSRVPLLIGANGDRMLRLTAEHADIAAFTGARPGATPGTLAPLTAEELDGRVAHYRESAAGRTEPSELNLLIQIVAVTDDPEPVLKPLLERQPGLSLERALELPIILVGPLEDVVERVRAQRERFGFSYLTVLEPCMEAFAPVMQRLREESAC